MTRWIAALAACCLAGFGVIVTCGVLFLGTFSDPKPTWFLVSEERIPGDRIDLLCIQETNREELISPASVPLRLGDKTRTVCTVVPKEKP